MSPSVGLGWRQRQMLQLLAEHRLPPTNADAYAWTVLRTLFRRGLITCPHYRAELTDEGRAAIQVVGAS